MVTICRHGQTQWNKAWKLQWRLDSPLTQKWIVTAITIADLLNKEWQFVPTIHSSPLWRAHGTSKIIRDTLKPHPQIVLDDRLREMSFWTHEWMLKVDRRVWNFCREISNRAEDPFNIPLPWGENYSQVKDRVQDFVGSTEIFAWNVIVAHEALNRMLVWVLTWMSNQEAMNISQPNSVIYRVIDGDLYHNDTLNSDWWRPGVFTLET